MSTYKDQLSKRLLYLPVSILGRVEFWITYRDVKQASSATLRAPFDTSKRNTTRIVNWLTDAEMYFSIDQKNADLIHISKSENLANKMATIQWSELKKNITFRGYSYGYPTKAVDFFAKDPHKLVQIRNDEKLKKYYWKPYVRYIVRPGYEYEDSLVAKEWGDLIRKDVPLLAKWFEKRMNELQN